MVVIKRILIILITLVFLFISIACYVLDKSPVAIDSIPIVVTDQAGRVITIEAPTQRIVSGYYISTSTCLALGLSDKLVGIEARAETRPIYALAQPELLDLPSVGTARDFNIEACIALNPDLVILPFRLRDVAETLDEMGISVIIVNPESFDKMLEMIKLIGEVTGANTRSEQLIEWIKIGQSFINEQTATLLHKPSIYFAAVSSYLMTAPNDMFQAELITIAGGLNAAADIKGNGWTEISYEQLLVKNPDIIVIASEASYTIDDILNDPILSELNAVQNNLVFHVPSFIEAWDSPIPASIFGIKWLFEIILQYNNMSIDDLINMIPELDFERFYHEFYDVELD
ncbi:MAG: ABC transporter substrate-binding protein [Oscillospiraceae bacterium]|jgi:iron complex transport system substrate-binding protein|nr:ABC transporter substrate-binding protein [Oscillospiraceae bacterium]